VLPPRPNLLKGDEEMDEDDEERDDADKDEEDCGDLPPSCCRPNLPQRSFD
jgi:hypothetical protein